MDIIARIHTDFPTKFGVPRQSGLVPELKARIVFEPPYREATALRGLEGFDFIWLIWGFSANDTPEVTGEGDAEWATVRPPRLGGNTRMGVWATRSPFRPNGLALSSVKIERIELDTPEGPVITVSGADLMDGTPIYDIKPYITFTDSHPEARSGYVDTHVKPTLSVDFPYSLLSLLPADKRHAAIGVLEQDPRPSYQTDPERIYGIAFAGFDIRFRVDAELHATVVDVVRLPSEVS
ncbi:MAG: tRNA (N6-threonylcarbamoyladenosine(37)-N6)-methyltransferase TrmO [Bacteroidaceae bacterium]|nr:tRNA (N6-threonylcarbamoyladenosine(37)-N6)-methyltransferase TrmO [Bacteroidaceae bacterium]